MTDLIKNTPSPEFLPIIAEFKASLPLILEGRDPYIFRDARHARTADKFHGYCRQCEREIMGGAKRKFCSPECLEINRSALTPKQQQLLDAVVKWRIEGRQTWNTVAKNMGKKNHKDLASQFRYVATKAGFDPRASLFQER